MFSGGFILSQILPCKFFSVWAQRADIVVVRKTHSVNKHKANFSIIFIVTGNSIKFSLLIKKVNSNGESTICKPWPLPRDKEHYLFSHLVKMATAQRHYETAYYLRSAFEKLMRKGRFIETWNTDVIFQMTGTRGEYLWAS
jgi:hypothetical protein